MYYNEKDLRNAMNTEAYRDSNHPDHEKVTRLVKQGYDNLYPDDDRNEHPEKYYVWRTVGDNRVRSSHAQREGEVFAWDNPPEGGHPGQDYNCRCRAEPYEPPEDYYWEEKEADIGWQIKNQVKHVDDSPFADDKRIEQGKTDNDKKKEEENNYEEYEEDDYEDSYDEDDKFELFNVKEDITILGVLDKLVQSLLPVSTAHVDTLNEKNAFTELLKDKGKPLVKDKNKILKEIIQENSFIGHHNIDEKRHIVFDGKNLKLIENDVVINSIPAVSGKNGFQDSSSQKMKNKGPIPEGVYLVKQKQLQSIKDISSYDRLKGKFGFGTWPWLETAWGESRVWLLPANETNTYGRTGFSIHGGSFPVSIGCIDLTKRINDFKDWFTSGNKDVILNVDYK